MIDLETRVLQADQHTWKRIGSIPGCIALNSADIGQAKVNGKRVFTTWGRNLDAESQQWYLEHTNFQPIHFSAGNGVCELVLPDELALQMIAIIYPTKSK